MAEIVIPNEISRTVTVKRFPGWIRQAMGSIMWGWLLVRYDVARLPNGKWRLIVRWKRGDGHLGMMTSPSYASEWSSGLPVLPRHMVEIEKFQVYPRAGIRTIIRMLWLLLRSKPICEGNGQC